MNENPFVYNEINAQNLAGAMREINRLENIPRHVVTVGRYQSGPHNDQKSGTFQTEAYITGLNFDVPNDRLEMFSILEIRMGAPWIKLWNAETGGHITDLFSQPMIDWTNMPDYNTFIDTRRGPGPIRNAFSRDSFGDSFVIHVPELWVPGYAPISNADIPYYGCPWYKQIVVTRGSGTLGRSDPFNFIENSTVWMFPFTRVGFNYAPNMNDTALVSGQFWQNWGNDTNWKDSEPFPQLEPYIFGRPGRWDAFNENVIWHDSNYGLMVLGNYYPLDSESLFQNFNVGQIRNFYGRAHTKTFCFNGEIFLSIYSNGVGPVIVKFDSNGNIIGTIQKSEWESYPSAVDISWVNISAQNHELHPVLVVGLPELDFPTNRLYFYDFDGNHINTMFLENFDQCVLGRHFYGSGIGYRMRFSVLPDRYKGADDSLTIISGDAVHVNETELAEVTEREGTYDKLGRIARNYAHVARYNFPRIDPPYFQVDSHIPRFTKWTRYEYPNQTNIGLFPNDSAIEGSGVYAEYLIDLRNAIIGLLPYYRPYVGLVETTGGGEYHLETAPPLNVWNWEQDIENEDDLGRLLYLWNLYFFTFELLGWGKYGLQMGRLNFYHSYNDLISGTPLYDLHIGEIWEPLGTVANYDYRDW